jgi:hypothetical protein
MISSGLSWGSIARSLSKSWRRKDAGTTIGAGWAAW